MTCVCLHYPCSLKCTSFIKKVKNCIEGQGRWVVQFATGNCGKCTVVRSVVGTFSIAKNRIWGIWKLKWWATSILEDSQSVVWVLKRAIILHAHQGSSFLQGRVRSFH